MIRNLLHLLADDFVHRRIGLMVAVVVAALLAMGLSLRPRYIAEATVDIGGISSMGDDPVGLVRFLPFEDGNAVEAFFSHEVFTKFSGGIDGRCSAAALYSPNGQRIKMTCRGENESQLRELTLSALSPLLERHARHYEILKTIEEQRQNFLDFQIRSADQMIAALRKPPVSSLSEALIIEHQVMIKKLLNHVSVERMLGNRVRQTQIDSKGITVRDRKPGLVIWAAVAVLALFSGLFTMVLSASLKRLKQEVHHRNA